MDSRINYLLLGTALLGTFFSGTATRIVAISMPTVAQSLGTDLLGISWALLSYQLSNIGLSVIFGRISDLWGREKMFALGFVVFAMSSLLCGLSQTVLQLILAFEFPESKRRRSRVKIRPASWRRSIPLFSQLLYCASQECSHQLCAVRPSQPETKRSMLARSVRSFLCEGGLQ